MIAIFTILSDAEKLCDKIHLYLQENCPGYNAERWQVPVKSDKANEWYVQLPQEWKKNLYPVSTKIDIHLKPETDLAKELIEKLPADFISNTTTITK